MQFSCMMKCTQTTNTNTSYMNNFALQLRELIDDTSHCSMVFYVNIFMFDDVQRMTNTSLLMILLVESNY